NNKLLKQVKKIKKRERERARKEGTRPEGQARSGNGGILLLLLLLKQKNWDLKRKMLSLGSIKRIGTRLLLLLNGLPFCVLWAIDEAQIRRLSGFSFFLPPI